MIKYALPGMYEHSNFYFKLLEIKQLHPEYFLENTDIEIIYGNPQFCIWDGGRIFTEYIQTTREEIEDIINIYNNVFNIPIRYVFTNRCLEEKHYYNRFGNILMEIGSKGPNEVVVSDDNFMQFLKKNYPTYKYVSSTTKCLINPEEAKAELNKEEYDLVCLDYNLNHHMTFLESLTPEEKKKTEFLVNAICGPACPNRLDHYYKNSQSHLEYGRPYHMGYCAISLASGNGSNVRSHHLTYENIYKTYEPLGFEHYKIEGRTWTVLDLALTICNYLIKPEYKNEILGALLS